MSDEQKASDVEDPRAAAVWQQLGDMAEADKPDAPFRPEARFRVIDKALAEGVRFPEIMLECFRSERRIAGKLLAQIAARQLDEKKYWRGIRTMRRAAALGNASSIEALQHPIIARLRLGFIQGAIWTLAALLVAIVAVWPPSHSDETSPAGWLAMGAGIVMALALGGLEIRKMGLQKAAEQMSESRDAAKLASITKQNPAATMHDEGTI